VKILSCFMNDGDERLHLVVDELPTEPLEDDIYEDENDYGKPIMWRLRKFDCGIYRFEVYPLPLSFGTPGVYGGCFSAPLFGLAGGWSSNTNRFNGTGILEHEVEEVVLHVEKGEYLAHVGYYMENK
jgi:hypothetical protein